MQGEEQPRESCKERPIIITNVVSLKDVQLHSNDTNSTDVMQFMNVRYLDKRENSSKIDSPMLRIKSDGGKTVILTTPLESIDKETVSKSENKAIVLNNDSELSDYLKSQSKVLLLRDIDAKGLVLPDILPRSNSNVEVKNMVKGYRVPLLRINIDRIFKGSVSDSVSVEHEEETESVRLKYHKLPLYFTDKNKPYIMCPVCSAVFFKSKLFQSHFLTHVYRSAKNYVCVFCKYSNEDANVMFEHLGIHQNQCESCKLNLTSKNNFDKHWAISSATFTIKRDHLGRFVCAFCKLVFDFKHQLKKHSFRYSCNEQEVYQCSVCSGTFTTKDVLENHMCLTCPICKKTFENLQRLKSHTSRMNHSLKCPTCLYEFVFASDYKKHLTLHEEGYCLREYYVHCLEAKDGKSFQCELCNKIFYILSQLIFHVHKDHGVKDVFKKFIQDHTKKSKWKTGSYGVSETKNKPVTVCWDGQSTTTSKIQSGDKSTQPHLYQCASCKKLFPNIESTSLHIKMEHVK